MIGSRGLPLGNYMIIDPDNLHPPETAHSTFRNRGAMHPIRSSPDSYLPRQRMAGVALTELAAHIAVRRNPGSVAIDDR